MKKRRRKRGDRHEYKFVLKLTVTGEEGRAYMDHHYEIIEKEIAKTIVDYIDKIAGEIDETMYV